MVVPSSACTATAGLLELVSGPGHPRDEAAATGTAASPYRGLADPTYDGANANGRGGGRQLMQLAEAKDLAVLARHVDDAAIDSLDGARRTCA